MMALQLQLKALSDIEGPPPRWPQRRLWERWTPVPGFYRAAFPKAMENGTFTWNPAMFIHLKNSLGLGLSYIGFSYFVGLLTVSKFK